MYTRTHKTPVEGETHQMKVESKEDNHQPTQSPPHPITITHNHHHTQKPPQIITTTHNITHFIYILVYLSNTASLTPCHPRLHHADKPYLHSDPHLNFEQDCWNKFAYMDSIYLALSTLASAGYVYFMFFSNYLLSRA